MRIHNFTVSFEKQDAHFLKKYGYFKATRMVFQRANRTNMPFIHDTYQLAHVLGMTRRDLFRLSRSLDRRYRTLKLKKANGKWRTLHEPDAVLKQAQIFILHDILRYAPVSRYATAYIAGKSLRDNALPHVGHRYLLKLDITDFFDSVTYQQILSAAFNSKLYPQQIGAMLTAFCCRNERLPQGAPTSPTLSNLVMRRFDDALGGWCAERGITYTRYCDDLTFSADVPLYAVYQKACGMLAEMGFEVNRRKTHFITSATRQSVTGLTVNEKVSVPSDYKRALRQEIYYAVRFGLRDAIVSGGRTAYIEDGRPQIERYYHHLKGCANYVVQIEPQNVWFREALGRLDVAFSEEFT